MNKEEVFTKEEQLWRDVIIALASSNSTCTKESAIAWSNSVVEAFRNKFPRMLSSMDNFTIVE